MREQRPERPVVSAAVDAGAWRRGDERDVRRRADEVHAERAVVAARHGDVGRLVDGRFADSRRGSGDRGSVLDERETVVGVARARPPATPRGARRSAAPRPSRAPSGVPSTLTVTLRWTAREIGLSDEDACCRRTRLRPDARASRRRRGRASQAPAGARATPRALRPACPPRSPSAKKTAAAAPASVWSRRSALSVSVRPKPMPAIHADDEQRHGDRERRATPRCATREPCSAAGARRNSAVTAGRNRLTGDGASQCRRVPQVRLHPRRFRTPFGCAGRNAADSTPCLRYRPVTCFPGRSNPRRGEAKSQPL